MSHYFILDIINPQITEMKEYQSHVNTFFWIFTALFFMNVLAFALFAFDKQQAIKKRTRVPELVLHLTAILGGPFGAVMAMLLCRHKTRHLTFQIVVPLFFVIWTVVAVYLYVYQYQASLLDFLKSKYNY